MPAPVPSPRWLAVAREIGWGRLALTALIVLVMSALCVVAGRWQYGRYVTKADAIEAYDAAQAHDVADVEEVAGSGDELADGAEWRAVTVTGVIDPDSVVALRNRPVDSTAAYQYLAWMSLDDGTAVLVNLGWAPVPSEDETEAALADALPQGEVTLTGTLRRFEEDDGKRDAGATRIVPAQVDDPGTDSIVPGYVIASDGCAGLCGDDGPLDEVPLPTLSLGPHLSYAWQWWAFSLLVPVGAWLLTKRDLELKRDPSGARPAPAKPRRRRHPSDEEIEDAL
ncbi:SURF1 family protein [Demequina salsinemoris]|uniref:SURF1 family protein n=1 Tax=Demequina salsinemoris TaxID=577470 RepID=UPI0007821BB3|nr:SURF1 family protein [Demequina salsinemoris]